MLNLAMLAMRIPIKKRTVQGLVRYVVDLRGKGRPNKRSFFKTKAEAEKFADQWKSKIAEEQTDPPIILVGREKRDYLAAMDIADGKFTLVEAALCKREHSKTVTPHSMVNAVGHCVAAKRASGKNRDYLSIFENRLLAFSAFAGKPHCHEVTQEDVERWLSTRSWKNITKRGALVDLGTFFNFCLNKSWVTSNPCEHVEQIRIDQFARGILTPEQASIFIRTVAEKDSGLVRYFTDQMFGGLRELEARMLTHRMEHKLHIELPGDDIYEPGFIEWNPTWKAWRDEYPGEYYPIQRFQVRIDKVKAWAKGKMIEEKVADKDWWFPRNCLRHSFCTYASKVWGTGKAADLARHSEAMQKKHYRRPIPLEDAKAFWAILP